MKDGGAWGWALSRSAGDSKALVTVRCWERTRDVGVVLEGVEKNRRSSFHAAVFRVRVEG